MKNFPLFTFSANSYFRRADIIQKGRFVRFRKYYNVNCTNNVDLSIYRNTIGTKRS